MAENKKSFVLYADLISVVEKLVIKDRENNTNYAGELFLHILKYVNDKEPVPIDFIIEMTFEPIRLQLKRDLHKYETIKDKRSSAGKKSAEIKKQNATKSTSVESVAECSTLSTVNDNDNDNDNDNVILLKKETKHDDEAPEIFADEIDNAKNFLKTEKKIQMDRLKMKYNLSPENLHDKIDEFIDKKSDWGETGWKDNYEMAKNFELWLKTNHKVIINPFKTMTEKEFHADVGKFEKEFGKKMLTDFYRYWNQPTETGEMRFQEKNAWNTENQLKIWKSRNNGK